MALGAARRLFATSGRSSRKTSTSILKYVEQTHPLPILATVAGSFDVW
jgi:hypothetical protein